MQMVTMHDLQLLAMTTPTMMTMCAAQLFYIFTPRMLAICTPSMFTFMYLYLAHIAYYSRIFLKCFPCAMLKCQFTMFTPQMHTFLILTTYTP